MICKKIDVHSVHLGVSIIIPTLGRKQEVLKLLESLQRYLSSLCYEIIIVDQNQEDFLSDLLQKFPDLPIKHHRVNFSGLAKARNYGIKQATKDYVFFADDDMRFMSDSLCRSFEYLEKNKDFCSISGCMVNESGAAAVSCFSPYAHQLDVKKHFRGYFVESSMLFRKELFDKYEFDENLGCGRFHGAEEGADLIFRILTDGNKIYYDPDLKYNEEAMQRDIEKYGLYTYEDFSDYISYEAYLSSPSVYLKVAVGKGMITYEQIIDVINYLLAGSLID